MTPRHQPSVWTPVRRAGLAGLLLLWFGAAYVIGAEGLLASDRPALLPPIALGAIVPVALFLLTYGVSERFRRFVLAQDIRTLTVMQNWRVIGFVFLPLYAFGLLPGLFALPAGLGDVAIGMAAAFVVARMDRDSDYARSGRFVGFHLLGLLDFAVAIATAGLSGGLYPALIPGGVTSAPMEVWPLSVFPSFGVPIFIILHLTVLLKVRHLRRIAREPVGMDAAVPAA